MSACTLPVQRPTGRAIVVGSGPCRALAVNVLHQLGCPATELDDAYSAMAELCRRPLLYRTLIFSLNSLYREELQIILTIKQRFPGVEVWLAHADGRAASLAEAMRLGADGLLSEDGLHRFALPPREPTPVASPAPVNSPPAIAAPTPPPAEEEPEDDETEDGADFGVSDPVLTAEELRALLHDSMEPRQE